MLKSGLWPVEFGEKAFGLSKLGKIDTGSPFKYIKISSIKL